MRRPSLLAAATRVASLAIALAFATFGGVAKAAELIMIERQGCPWCKAWDEQIAPAYPRTPEGRRAPLRRLDIGAVGQSRVTFAGPITATPTFILVENEREVGRITGYPGPDFFWGLLADLLGKLDIKKGTHLFIRGPKAVTAEASTHSSKCWRGARLRDCAPSRQSL